MSPRIAISCLAAYVVGSYINNYIMSKLKNRWNGKYFKCRAMLSTVCGEFSDAVVVTFSIFFGVLPLSTVLSITFSMALVKICLEAMVLPITSRIVNYVKSKEGEVKFDESSYKLFSLNV